MTKRSAIGAVLGLGLVGSLILAGCGAGSSGNGGTTGGTSAASSSAATTGGTTAATTGGKTAATTGGKTASAGAGTAVKTDGNFVMVQLAFNDQVFGVSGQASPTPCFDQGGNCLDPTDPVWPNKGKAGEAKVGSVDVYMPDTGGGSKAVKSAINVGPELGGTATVAVPQGKYKNMDVITGSGNGPGTVDVTFNYSDGSKDSATFSSDDWCSSSPTGTPAFIPADRWDANGSPTTPACGVFLDTLPIPGASKTLTSVVFTNDSANPGNFEPNILAVTLEKA